MNFKNNFILLLLLVFYIFVNYENTYAVDIVDIKILGKTVDIVLDKIENYRNKNLTKEEIDALSVYLTEEYHKRGYTTSFVQKVVLRKNGVLEFYIRESRIRRIIVDGGSPVIERDIKSFFPLESEEVYNKFTLSRRIEVLKKRHNLEKVFVDVFNYNDTPDVVLKITLVKGRDGFFTGAINFEPIYGLSPFLRYFLPCGNSAFDVKSGLGYNDGEFRKIEAELKVHIINAFENKSGFYLGVNTKRMVEYRISPGGNYNYTSVAPCAGLLYVYKFLMLDVSVNERISDLNGYMELEYRDYDTNINMELSLSDRNNLVIKKDSTDLKMQVSLGTSKLNSGEYIQGAMDFKTSFLPVIWMRIVPVFYSYYTTSEERFFRVYVFDKYLLGFSEDYTASSWKNILGLDIEFELLSEIFYMGPMINGGYYRNDTNRWEDSTGAGMKCRFLYGKIDFNFYYTWNIENKFSKGNFNAFATGSF